MEGASNTDSIRALASKWSLAGDDQLLNLLQNTHQRIVSKCQEVNSKLEEMASALDDTAINLQNVNNKFMALSNSQFIESRVYDDDADVTTDAPPIKEPQKPPAVDEVSILKRSLAILERWHETTEILDDSDSDSSDAEISVVLKPKDMYSHRPLPHIIGTQPWKNKWHAGLIVEASDTDSSGSRAEEKDLEQYSDSDSETEQPQRQLEDQTISETSSSFTSEQPIENTPPVKPTPSDIAAELARRLGGPHTVIEQEPEEYSPPVPTTRKVYKPEQPATSTIFPDEPPPLDVYEPDDIQSEDDDIFAEINKHKPYTQRNPVPNLAEDLFSFDKPHEVDQGDIFSDFAPKRDRKPSAKQKSTLFQDESEPELFAEPPKKVISPNNNHEENQDEISTKKPVGGISLFGSNKGAESIGAAILKRNRRKSSTSGDESGNDNTPNPIPEEKPKIVPKNINQPENIVKAKTVDETDNKSLPKKEKDIFDDLFSKPQTVAAKKPVQKTVKEDLKEKEKKNVKDLFSNDIFDDIDDIFTDIKILSKDTKQKSIFDDDTDLFSDVAKPKPIVNPTSSKDKKGIFDSDDELFSDVKVKGDKSEIESQEDDTIKHKNSEKLEENAKNQYLKATETDTLRVSQDIMNQENILDIAKKENVPKVKDIVKPTDTKERKLFDDSPQIIPKPQTKQIKTKSIFDSDSDDDIFASIKVSNNKSTETTNNAVNKDVNTNLVKADNAKVVDSFKVKDISKVVQSPSLFDDDDDEGDDLFADKHKKEIKPKTKKEKIVVEEKDASIDILDKDKIVTDSKGKDSKKNSFDNVVSKEENNLPSILPENIKSHTKQNVIVKSDPIAVNNEDILKSNLQEDNLFSTPKETQSKEVPSHIIEEELVTDVIEPSQEESKIETRSDSKPQFEENRGSEEKTDIDFVSQEPNLKNTVPEEGTEPVKEKEILTTEEIGRVSNEPDIFDDIFTEPPAFEKPAEPKKSRNVNALFDDDSDDETLFFKKDDVISDEKPEIFSDNANFDIFVDEPPDVDIDFTAKPNKDGKGDDIFSPTPKIHHKDPDNDTSEALDKDINTDTATNNTTETGKDLDHDKNNDNLFSSPILFENPLEIQTRSEDNAINIETTITTVDILQTKLKDNLFTEDLDEDLFGPTKIETVTTKEEKVINKIGKEIEDSYDDLFSNLPKPKIPTSSQNIKSEQKSQTEENKRTNESKYEEIVSKESPKKIGKINTKNFNINVNALMPGASPKRLPKEQNVLNIESDTEQKTPKTEEIDNTESKTSSDFNTEKENQTASKVDVESKAAKTITFEDEPDSEILDNNLSKQRPRIQVKRRPSSRRARHEAARRSTIDFADDTDNSSSFDEPVKSRQKNDDLETESRLEDQDLDKPNESLDNNASKSSSIDNNKTISTDGYETSLKTASKNEKGSKTKVVYILNDEDIFNTKSNDIFGGENLETKSDIFRNTEAIQTLGNTYKEHAKEVTKIVKKDEENESVIKEDMNKVEDTQAPKEDLTKPDIFTKNTKSSNLFQDSDEELFGRSQKVVKKASIFDSDSEEDLFSGKKRKEKKNEEQRDKEVKEKKTVNIKASLFGDDDDDDDLFGTKKNKIETKQPSKPSTSREAFAPKSTEIVFDDPLSMLGDD